jgi:hypothetical protein
MENIKIINSFFIASPQHCSKINNNGKLQAPHKKKPHRQDDAVFQAQLKLD